MDLSAIIRSAIEIGDRPGFITFDQIKSSCRHLRQA